MKNLSITMSISAIFCFLTACNSNTDTNASTQVEQTKPLNVLYIMTDDHAAHAVGVYEGRFAKLNPTPNIDKLADEGMVFTNTFVTNSICTPSRASILTGQYSQTNGVLDLRGSISTENQHLPTLMSNAGYQTAIIGKWHLKKEPGAFDYYQVLEGQGTYFDPTFRIQGENVWPKNEVQYKGYSSDVVTDISIDWLKNKKNNKPFFLMHQFKAPHDMFEYAPRYEDYLAAETIPEPTDLYGVKATFGSIATRGVNDKLIKDIGTSVSKRHNRRSMGIDLGVDPSLPEEEFTRQAYQKYVKAYLRCVKGVDDNIARLLQTLKDIGEYDNTIIIYTSDQGMMLGEHDFQDKRWMYEESIRMPFIVKDPRMTTQGQKSDLLVNNTDFAPLILDLVGIKVPEYMHGKSFAPALQGKTPDNWRTASYYRYWTHRAYHDVPAHFGLRTKDYKLIFFYGANFMTKPFPFYDKKWVAKTGLHNSAINTPAAWELYDLRKDPTEQNNVYSNPEYSKVVDELKIELKRQRKLYNETDEQYPHLQKIIDKHWND
ncbi:sulfatase family protein [Pseudocolwellia agarivorans]|uniref:sulfatase family protein n=1 Tax=Pseudocolwellia agarivorans TaxID=1911682 RepID=UPI000986AC3F|nr:sulfatase [Pseudocolwellia agarivorans]